MTQTMTAIPNLTNPISIVTNILIMKKFLYPQKIIPFTIIECDEKKKEKNEENIQDLYDDKAIKTNVLLVKDEFLALKLF